MSTIREENCCDRPLHTNFINTNRFFCVSCRSIFTYDAERKTVEYTGALYPLSSRHESPVETGEKSMYFTPPSDRPGGALLQLVAVGAVDEINRDRVCKTINSSLINHVQCLIGSSNQKVENE